MKNFKEKIMVGTLIFALILGTITIYQIIKILIGGSWESEQALFALVCLNISMTFGLFIYTSKGFTKINTKLHKVDKKLHGHILWHKGKELH